MSKILISGATGLVGSRLADELGRRGHDVFRLVRRSPADEREIRWSERSGFAEADAPRLEGFDAVFHLAGDNVAAENWSAEKKRRIRESRTVGTRVLVEALGRCSAPPKVFVAASAIGFYGNRGDEILTEESPKGEGFFPEVCSKWEAESEKAAAFGARVVTTRIGIVLTRDGGALEKMLTPFRFGLGGVVGSGRQWMSWIALDDLIALLVHVMENGSLSGPVNATAPNPVTNEVFTKTFGRVLGRPTIVPVPEFAIRLMFGEMGETLLLQGNRVLPKRLEASGFRFSYPELETALRHVLG